LKRLLLAIMVIALIAALMSPAAQAQGAWYWCWNDSIGDWESCWWDDGIDQGAGQESDAGEVTQTFNISTIT
jgi:hypothetical protein